MALFVQKALHWNPDGYKGPAGYEVTSDSFPAKTGFGHEEWNNDPRMVLKTKNGDLRFFHTEHVEAAMQPEHHGQVFVFMTVSYDKKQYFVGIAANATNLSADALKQRRLEIGEKLGIDGLQDEVWDVELVREKYEDHRKKFSKDWKADLHWIPNWVCADTDYWWFDEPVEISSLDIRGVKRWLSMFSSYTKLDASQALAIMDAIPQDKRASKWAVIYDAMASAQDVVTPLDVQIDAAEDDAKKILTKQVMAAARLGQGWFRSSLLNAWNHQCALTGIDCSEMLKASHIKPWSKSNNKEKLDPNNGLLLSANIDALFDKFLISFSHDGVLLVSPKLSNATVTLAGLDKFKKLLKVPSASTAEYLDFHREEFESRF